MRQCPSKLLVVSCLASSLSVLAGCGGVASQENTDASGQTLLRFDIGAAGDLELGPKSYVVMDGEQKLLAVGVVPEIAASAPNSFEIPISAGHGYRASVVASTTGASLGCAARVDGFSGATEIGPFDTSPGRTTKLPRAEWVCVDASPGQLRNGNCEQLPLGQIDATPVAVPVGGAMVLRAPAVESTATAIEDYTWSSDAVGSFVTNNLDSTTFRCEKFGLLAWITLDMGFGGGKCSETRFANVFCLNP